MNNPPAEPYFPVGLLAVNPAFLGTMLKACCPAQDFVLDSTCRVATVDIGGGGPLEHHAHPMCDSYDEIKSRVQAACQSTAEFVLLSIDSPGGLLAGCFDTVTELRAIAAQSNKRLVAYIDSQATSAAYALALAADYITIPTTGLAGSIGVIEGLGDETIADRIQGRQYKFLASGELKTSGNTHIPFAEREAGIQAAAQNVDGLADEFFKLVATYRPTVSSEKAKSLQAGIFFGANAVAQGLADQVLTLDETVRMLSTTGWPTATTINSPEVQTENPNMNLRAYLAKVADDESASPEDREHAKRSLAAYDEKPTEPDGDEPAEAPKKDEAKAESESPPATEPDGDEKKPAAVAPSAPAAQARALAGATSAEHYAKISALATRPDFTVEQRKTLLALDFAAVKSAVETWPKMAVVNSTPAGHVAAAINAQSAKTSQPAPSAGESKGLPANEANDLAVRMGLKAQANTAHWTDDGFYRISAAQFARPVIQKESK